MERTAVAITAPELRKPIAERNKHPRLEHASARGPSGPRPRSRARWGARRGDFEEPLRGRLGCALI
eukprot:15485126-Alexandrium_andersonii.AAC.1